jgi:hypothetical protein
MTLLNNIQEKTASFYFADHRLTVQGGRLWSGCPLNVFSEERPYSTESRLFIDGKSTPDEGGLIANEAGVKISHCAPSGWLFQSDETENLCHIESSWNYSELRGFYDQGACRNKLRLHNKFMQILRISTESLLCFHNGISLHASCVIFNGRAILFAAPSGTGKSTQAAFWQKHMNATLLSGDRPHIKITENGAQVYGVPWDGKEQCFSLGTYPVAAIIELSQSKNNHLEPLGQDQAFRLLMHQGFIPMWDDSAKFKAMETIKALAGQVPFYRLLCNLDLDAVSLVAETIYKCSCIFGRSEPEMRVKDGFILRHVVDEWIVMPKGSNIKNFDGAVILNDVSAHIWQQLEKSISKPDLLLSVLEEFDIEKEFAAKDLEDFLQHLKSLDILIDIEPMVKPL